MHFLNDMKKYGHAIEKVASEYRISKFRVDIDCIKCRVLHGASVSDYIGFSMFRMNHLERNQFVTGRRSEQIERLFNTGSTEDKEIIGNKWVFNRVFSAFIQRDWIYASESTNEEIEAFLRCNQNIVVKPLSLSKGVGVYIVKSEQIIQEGLDAFIQEAREKKLLLEGYIRQHPMLRAVNPSSVNTIRICSVRDRRGEVHIIGASLRAGGKDMFVDNLHAGGVQYPIDVQSGCICRGGVLFNGEKNILFHPSTKMKMIGLQIPNWKQVVDVVKEAGKIPAHMRYIGWDIAITEDGCEIVEANYGQGRNGMQQDGVGKYNMIMQYR